MGRLLALCGLLPPQPQKCTFLLRVWALVHRHCPGSVAQAEHSGGVCVSFPNFGFRTWGRRPGNWSLVVVLEPWVLLNKPGADSCLGLEVA